jgi:hypothetical protein
MKCFTILSLTHIFVSSLILQLALITTGYSLNGRNASPRYGKILQSKPFQSRTKLNIVPDTEGEINPLVAKQNSKPEGYMSSDLSSNEDGKQGRVFGYILFALVPVLVLVPFLLSKNFEPPVDPDMAPVVPVTVISKTVI